jgi:tetraacyldisaccharide 4'-kinase
MEAWLRRNMWGDSRTEFLKPLHIFFYLLSLPYGGAVRIRNFLFDLGFLKQGKLNCPVISVGNITVGGTGKTPMVILLAGMLRNRGLRPAVLSRGYGGKRKVDVLVVSDGRQILAGPEEAGDEPVLIARRLKDVPVLVGPKRTITGQYALRHFEPGVILLDDGFQHRYLKRDLDIVLLDSRKPLGNRFLLPRGPLREPVSALERAGVIAFTRSEKGAGKPIDVTLSGSLSGKVALRTCVSPASLTGPAGLEYPLSFLQGKRVFALAGIAQPDSFRQTIESLGGIIAGFRIFPDHHRYGTGDISRVEEEARSASADVIVTTEKDAVKLDAFPLFAGGVYRLGVTMELLEGETDLEELLRCIPGL